MNSLQIVGERIKFYRTVRGLTQKELEKELGVAPRYISNIEQGNRGPSLDMQVKICQYFGISMAELIPMEILAELTPRDKMIGEIVSVCRTLGSNQIGVVKTMVCAFKNSTYSSSNN